MKTRKGFTLIELIVAVAIVGILAAIALPSYREYVMRGHRRAAQAAMMDIATRQQQFFVANRAYATKAELGYQLPEQVGDFYSYEEITLDPGPPPGFTITFKALPGQSSDGDLELDSNGVGTRKGEVEKWLK